MSRGKVTQADRTVRAKALTCFACSGPAERAEGSGVTTGGRRGRTAAPLLTSVSARCWEYGVSYTKL